MQILTEQSSVIREVMQHGVRDPISNPEEELLFELRLSSQSGDAPSVSIFIGSETRDDMELEFPQCMDMKSLAALPVAITGDAVCEIYKNDDSAEHALDIFLETIATACAKLEIFAEGEQIRFKLRIGEQWEDEITVDLDEELGAFLEII